MYDIFDRKKVIGHTENIVVILQLFSFSNSLYQRTQIKSNLFCIWENTYLPHSCVDIGTRYHTTAYYNIIIAFITSIYQKQPYILNQVYGNEY